MWLSWITVSSSGFHLNIHAVEVPDSPVFCTATLQDQALAAALVNRAEAAVAQLLALAWLSPVCSHTT
jgi:hypothetical protein